MTAVSRGFFFIFAVRATEFWRNGGRVRVFLSRWLFVTVFFTDL